MEYYNQMVVNNAVQHQINNSPKYWDCPICKASNVTVLENGYGEFTCKECGYEVGEYQDGQWL